MNPCKEFPMFIVIVRDNDGEEVRRFGPRSVNLLEETLEGLRKVFPEYHLEPTQEF